MFVSVSLLTILIVQPLTISAIDQHIVYNVDVPYGLWFASVYGVVTIGSFLISTKMLLRWFGVAVFVAYMVSAVAFEQAFISVWCFASAVLSLMLFVYIREEAKKLRVSKKRKRKKK